MTYNPRLDLSVFISETGTPVLGQIYTLFCNASNTSGQNITYMWKRDNTNLHEMTPTLVIPTVNLSHTGIYACIINDSYTTNKEVYILQSM